MARVLVAYASKHGATAEIAEAIADEIRRSGHDVDCVAAAEQPDVAAYDAVVLGSAVYMKRWRPEARRLLKRDRQALAERPLWAFSSGPFGEDSEDSCLVPPGVDRTLEKLGARGHVVFGGRVPADPQNFVERAIVKETPAEVSDLRDWDEIRRWAAAIAVDVRRTEAALQPQ